MNSMNFREVKSAENNPLKLYSYFIDVITVAGQVDDSRKAFDTDKCRQKCISYKME